MTFQEFQERYKKETEKAKRAFEEWEAQEEAERKRKEEQKNKKVSSNSMLTPVGDKFDDAEFLLEQLLLATSLMTVAMHHLSYYASAKGKDKVLDKNDQTIMQQTADEIEAFINLMEGEGISTVINEHEVIGV